MSAESLNADVSTDSDDDSKETIRSCQPSRFCHFAPSPYPVYVANVFYFMTVGINTVALEAVLYNKLCYQKYKDINLCSNSTFTKNHPILQVCVGEVSEKNYLAS